MTKPKTLEQLRAEKEPGDVLSQRGGGAGCDDKVEAGGQYVWILP